jgi:hypothetical protein
MVLLLCHIEPIVRSPILPARESGHSVSEPRKDSGRSRHAFSRPPWRFPSPSRSLRLRCPAAVRSVGRAGKQRGFYGQAAKELNRSHPAPGSHSRLFHQPVGRLGSGKTTSWQVTSWVERVLNANGPCNYNLCRIVWPRKRWPKPMACWCRSRSSLAYPK